MEVPLTENDDKKEESRVFFLKVVSHCGHGVFIVPTGHFTR